MMVWTPKDLADAVAMVDAAGFQAHIHTIGDAAVRSALDAVESAGKRNGARDRRAVLTHIQLVDPPDIPRFAELGVIINAQPLWAQLDDLMVVLTIPRLGGERAARQYAFATFQATGATLSFGSDWPCSSPRPFDGIRVAISRQTEGGAPVQGWTPQEKLGLKEALAAYTAGVAYQAFADTCARPWGQIRTGYSADLVWLDVDPRKLPRDQKLTEVEIVQTWLAGQPTFRAF